MKNEGLKSMESEGSGCTGGKVRGGLTIGNSNFGPAGALLEFTTGNFNFNFECICASDVIIPIPSSLIKSAAKSFLGKQGLDWILGFLKSKGASFRELLKPRTLKNLQTNLDKADAAWKAYRLKLANQIRPQYQSLIDQRNQIILAMKAANSPGYKLYRHYENFAKAVRRGWIDKDGVRVQLTPEMLESYKKRARDIIQQIPEPHGSQFKENFKQLIPLHKAEEEGVKLLDRASNIRQAKNKLEQAFSDPLANIEDTLGNVPPELSTFILDSLLTGLFTLLDILSIVQEKNCLSNQTGLPDGLFGAALNPENCRCELCASSKQLCDLRSWIADFLPSIPGTRQSDELNVCMECCDDAKTRPRWFRGNFVGDVIKEFGIPPCTCECPTETQKSAEDTEMVPMEWVECGSEEACKRGVFTSDKYACRSKNPPDKSASSPPGEISAYEWNSQECRWMCIEPCGADCCPSGEQCYDGTCRSCPPGYQKVRRSGRFFSSQEFGTEYGTDYGTESEFICEPDCNSGFFPCESNLCCEENPILSTFENKVYSCTICQKVHSFRIEHESDEPNPWR